MKFLSTFNVSFFQGVDYYSAIDRKLALRFINAVEAAKLEIERFPKVGNWRKTYRVLLLEEFPFNFCYYEDQHGELVGLVLFHHKQRECELQER